MDHHQLVHNKSPNMKHQFKILLILIISGFVSSFTLNNKNDTLKRTGRTVSFIPTSAMGMIIAIAIPLDYPERNIFMSYNFEGNYKVPTTASEVIPGILNSLQGLAAGNSRALGSENYTVESVSSSTAPAHIIKKRSMWSRKQVYEMLEAKLEVSGHNGKTCLLRAICESAETPLHEHNGIMGDIFHIILTPSTSMEENISNAYYMAEYTGRREKDCSQYSPSCPISAFDYITSVVDY